MLDSTKNQSLSLPHHTTHIAIFSVWCFLTIKVIKAVNDFSSIYIYQLIEIHDSSTEERFNERESNETNSDVVFSQL